MAGKKQTQDESSLQKFKRLFGTDEDDTLLDKVKASDGNRPLKDVEAPSDTASLFDRATQQKPDTSDQDATIDPAHSANFASSDDLDKLKDKLNAEQAPTPEEPAKTDTLADKVMAADTSAPPVPSRRSESTYHPAKLNDTFQSFYDKLKPAVEQMPDGAKRDAFATELADLKKQYADANSNIDKRELIETIANALGKIGAGAYGLKTGRDMSDVKFDKHDFGADRDRALKENQLGLNDLSDRRKEQQADDRFNAEQNFRKDSLAQQTALARDADAARRAQVGLQGDQLGETMRHNKAMEDLYGDKIMSMAAKQSAKGSGGKDLAELNKGAEELATKITGVAAGLNKKDFDEDTAKEQIQTYLMSDLGMTQAQAHDAVAEKGMLWGENLKDPSAILNQVNGLFAAQRTILQLKARTPQGQVLVIAPDGTPGYLPEANADAAEQQKYKVFR